MLAYICIGVLGFLVVGLGWGVSMLRLRRRIGIGAPDDPEDPFFKLVRAHANAAEYAPMLAVLMLVAGTPEPPAWVAMSMVCATAARLLHALGMVRSPSLARPHPLRFVGAAGTYLFGALLALAVLLRGATGLGRPT
ncbi:MAG TPA: MAPEG family protein [Candidatus Nitrosotenuis sp.]|jgi:uncharacterized membrane protein YecN with MAPEG domain|nr:MAPEG family protein [Candidatus Nitrosotenuis sp.]